jgi:DNA-binding SARP family transcriptional activator
LAFTLLGGFRARIGAGRALALPPKKARALLAYLAQPAGRAHPRDKLATLLWGDSPEGPARTSLRQALFALRRALPAGGLRVEGDTVTLDPAAVDVDVAAFERGIAEGTPAALTAAAQCYQGDLLAGLSVEGGRGSRSGCWGSGSGSGSWRWRAWRSCWRTSGRPGRRRERSRRG